jgi:hypothetical protein
MHLKRNKMSEEINQDRRRFLGVAAMTIAVTQLGMIGSAKAKSNEMKPASATTIKSGTNRSFGPLKQIDAGLLNVGYAEAGPAGGPAVILLHGCPTTFTATSMSPLCWHRRATG